MFVAFEGPDHCGKTTTASNVMYKLRDAGYSVRYTLEPGGTEIGQEIRELILYGEMSETARFFLYMADRAENYDQNIKPFLGDGCDFLLCDRYWESSLVYQTLGERVDAGRVADTHDIATASTFPDVTFVITADQPHKESDADDHWEQKGRKFWQEIKARYDALCQVDLLPYEICRIDTTEQRWEEYENFVVDKLTKEQ